jgi:hypothetical protein
VCMSWDALKLKFGSQLWLTEAVWPSDDVRFIIYIITGRHSINHHRRPEHLQC